MRGRLFSKSCAVSGCTEPCLHRHYCVKHHNASLGKLDPPLRVGDLERCKTAIMEAIQQGQTASSDSTAAAETTVITEHNRKAATYHHLTSDILGDRCKMLDDVPSAATPSIPIQSLAPDKVPTVSTLAEWTVNSHRFRQLPQPLFAHFIQTYLTDGSAFALIATDKETFHRYWDRYIMKSECTWFCLHHRSGDDPVNEWMFIHLQRSRDDWKLVMNSIEEATDEKRTWKKLADDPEPTPFNQLPQLQTNFNHSLSIGIMNPSRIKLREDSLQANVDLAAFKLPSNLKCFPSPLPHTVKHLFLTPTAGLYEGRTGISISFYSRWSKFILPNRLEVIEFMEAYPTYFDEKVNWPSTLHTMVIMACEDDFIIPDYPMYLPATITNLTVSFDSKSRESLKHVQLPPDLKRLEYRSANSSPNGWNLPSTLLELVLGDDFNEPIIDWILPPNLTRLQFGNKFNQSLVGVNWPKSLTEITIMGNYRCSLVDVTFPPSFKHLSIVTREHDR